jgi:hypothetical protein
MNAGASPSRGYALGLLGVAIFALTLPMTRAIRSCRRLS